MRENKFSLTIFFILFFASAFSETKTVTLGGKAGWPALASSVGLSRGKGRLGYEALALSSELLASESAAGSLPGLDARTGDPSAAGDDLYLSFDSRDVTDATGNYATVSSTFVPVGSSKARRGNGAALCNTDGSGLVLKGSPRSIFGVAGQLGSFGVDFWLYPSVTENGDVLFQWRSSRVSDGQPMYQYIRASLAKGRVEWKFSNVWTKTGGQPIELSLAGGRVLVPGTWSHHALSYDASTGLLEYDVDGSVEAIAYATSTGGESGDVFPAFLGTPADIALCPRYSGLIDEFRLRRSPLRLDSLDARHATLDRFSSGGGRFVSNPVDSGAANSSLTSISAVTSEPGGTGTAFFVRAGDNFYSWTDDYPAWIPVESGETLIGIAGRYFQVSGELYPDGTGSVSPSVTSVTLSIEEDSPPWPPARLAAVAGDGSVSLSWPASVDADVKGYLVYYGGRPGEYLDSGSPIDVGSARSCTVEGLKNGKLYYFSVAAYDAAGSRDPGELSAETNARPRAKRGE